MAIQPSTGGATPGPVGPAAQNVLLMAPSPEPGGVMVGAFEGDCIAAVAVLEKDEIPLCLRPVGYAVGTAGRQGPSG